MTATVSKWTPTILERLRTRIQEMITVAGKVNWPVLMTEFAATRSSLEQAYKVYVHSGHATSLSELQRRRRGKIAAAAPVSEQDVKTVTTENGLESTAVGCKIKTVEDLLKHIKADLTRYEIDKFEASKWDGQMKGPDDTPVVTELHRVWVRLKPKAGPGIAEQVESLIAGAFAKRQPVRHARTANGTGDLLNLYVIPEPHIGKFAWNAETGHGDYDLRIAIDALRSAAAEVADMGRHRKPAKRVIACIGDYFHVDTPAGTTTRGTALDQDGRIQKALKLGSEALFDLIAASAATAPTEVILTPGNHDEILTHALQRILVSEFRHDGRVTIDDTFTPRKYRLWGKTQLGFTHGNTPPIAKLPALMAREVPKDWGDAVYREIHTGDKHARAAIQTVDGVLVRTCPSLSAADKWHNENGYVGAARMMESFYYSQKGALVSMDASSPIVANGVL